MSTNSNNLDQGEKEEESTYKEWVKVWSKTHKAYYWFNSATNKSLWVHPSTVIQDPETQSKHIDEKISSEPATKRHRSDEYSSDRVGIRVAVIVPFRDNCIEQQRSVHLSKFIENMPIFFSQRSSIILGKDYIFKIFIVEQSNDKRKFNRGKLLNIGFDIAMKAGYNLFIFHDVDLLPSNDLLSSYLTIPTSYHPIHIARLWSRYNKNPKYFGGIVSFSKDMYEKINGFPNNFWGWGGEDDEMFRRVVEVGLSPVFPDKGSITDMEDMSLDSKLTLLRAHKLWKCMNKNEVLNEHDATWKSNGLTSLEYKELFREDLNQHSVKINVDVLLNGHWTDDRCVEDDTQLPPTSK